ncbi:MAG: cytochrome c [Alphaproteobacteria bacterium]|nr:cytochrome c [Alphaproteobacteria bacterium]
MKKFAFAALALATLGATAASAGPIEDRQAIMKGFAGPMKEAVALSRGTTPYTPAAAKAAMDPLAQHAETFIGLFPKGTEAGGAVKTGAGPAIWTDASGFKAAGMKFIADTKAAGSAKDQAGFADALKAVQADCGACHKTYRVTAP